MEKIVEAKRGKKLFRKPQRRTVAVGSTLLAVFAAYGVGVAAFIHTTEESAKAENASVERMGKSLDTAARNDGFQGFEYEPYVYGSRVGRSEGFAIGRLVITNNCSINSVQVRHDGEFPDVNDVTDYSFSTYAGGEVYTYEHKQGKIRRVQTGVRGAEVVLHFSGMTDLQENILGDTPCQALAASVGLVNVAEGAPQ